MPCLCLGKENFTPMELCKTEIASVKKLEPKQTSDMIKETAVPAYKRKLDIENMVRKTQLDTDPILRSYNIKLEYKMANVMGKVLSAPDLEYGQNRITASDVIGLKGSWDNMNKRFVEPCTLTNWIVINFGRFINQNQIVNFIDTLISTGGKHGVRIDRPIEIIPGDRCNDERKALEIFTKINDKHKKSQFYML